MAGFPDDRCPHVVDGRRCLRAAGHERGFTATGCIVDDVRWKTCPDCATHLSEHPLLVAACASVGIEHGQSIREMAVAYFETYHDRGHRDAAMSHSNLGGVG